jgi:hypothetical protein
MTGDRGSPAGNPFYKSSFDCSPPTGEVGIARRQGPQAMHVIGKDNPGVDAKGCAGAHPANRVAQYLDLRHEQIRTTVEQVHRKEESSARNPIAAIIRHAESMPELSERRNALRFSALRLLISLLNTAKEQPGTLLPPRKS